jgi:PAS domain S-box-containing protein
MLSDMTLRAIRESTNRLLLRAVRPCGSVWRALSGAVVLTVVMFASHILLGHVVESSSPLLCFLPAISMASLLWGWVSGLVSCGLSLVFGYYLLPSAPFTVQVVVEESIMLLSAAAYAAALRGALLTAERNFKMYRESEERFAFSQRSAGVGSWDVELKSGARFWSPSFREVLHMAPDLPATFENFLAAIHPDDVEEVRRRHELALRTGKYRAEYRLHPSRGMRWILSVGRVMSDKDGEGERFSGVLVDITSLKLTGQALRESRGTFEALAEVAPLGILVTNSEGEVRYANRFVRELTGVKRAEVRGRSWCELLQPDASLGLARAWDSCRRDLVPLSEEFRAPVLPNREFRWFHVQGVPIPFGEGGRTQWLLVVADIHERRTLSEKIRMLGDNLPNGAIYQSVDMPDGRSSLTYVSAGIQELTGYSAQSLMTAPCSFYDRILEDDREVLYRAEQQSRRTGKVLEVQFRILTASGEVRWLLCRAAPEQHGIDSCVTWDGVLIDITARRVAELALQASETKFRSLADSVPQLVWSCLPDGRAEYFNKGWLEYTGIPLRESLLHGWTHSVHPEDRDAVRRSWESGLTRGEPFQHECRLRYRRGAVYRWFITRAIPTWDSRGLIHRWVGSCTDVHDHKCFLEEREALLESERVARSEAEKANISKDQFVAVLSHELRSPLHAILGWVQMLKRGNLDPMSAQQALEVIDKNTRLQAQLISDLLDINRIASGKIKLEVHPVDVEEVLKGEVNSMMLVAKEKGVLLVHEPGQGAIVNGDSARLQQVFGNLISNAIKFTPPGGKVVVNSTVEASTVTVHVTDTGDGIEQEFIGRIFDRYSQGDPSSIRKHGGLGLGLSIVRHLTELHGGQVRVFSEGKGKGACFSVQLPCYANEHASALDQLPRPVDDGCLDGVKVMIVDDEEDSRELLGRILQDHKARVLIASGADEALERVNGFGPDVVVSDISMPGKDGYSLIKELKGRMSDLRSPPAIAVTAFALHEDRTRVLQAGFKRHLAKPVDATELVTAVKELVDVGL